jgi:hypothetical protein
LSSDQEDDSDNQEDDIWGCPESIHASKLTNPETETNKPHIPPHASAVPGQSGPAQWSSKNPNQTRQIDSQTEIDTYTAHPILENDPSDEEESRFPAPPSQVITINRTSPKRQLVTNTTLSSPVALVQPSLVSAKQNLAELNWVFNV